MDKEFFYEEMLMIVENNIKNTGDPMITEQQLEEAITNSRKRAIEDAMNSLVQKGILTPKAMSPNGDIFCGISDKVKIIIKNI